MHTTPLDLPLSRLDELRRRTVKVLFSGVALGSTGHIAAVTVATIVAEDLSGSPLLSGAPGAAVVLGAAVGAASLSRLMVAPRPADRPVVGLCDRRRGRAPRRHGAS